MKKVFSILLVVLLVIFEVKTDYDYDDILERRRAQQTRSCLVTKGKYSQMVNMYRQYRRQYRDDDYYEELLVNWCSKFCDRLGCKDLVDEYFDDDD